MKKWMIPAICAVSVIVLILTSLPGPVRGQNGEKYRSIGKSYNDFLFIPAKRAHFSIPFKSSYTGTLTLIDEKGRPLPADKYSISVDGKKTGPTFQVNNSRIAHVAIKCSKAVSPGKQYIRVRGGGPLITHVYFKHHLNPLVVWLSWFLALFSVVALAWFLVFRRVFYPQFRSSQKIFFIPNQQPLIVKMTGARKVVISSQKRSQSLWDALIKGPVVYKKHPAFASPITLTPVRGGKVLVKGDSSVYRIIPNPMPTIGSAAIDNVQSKIHITIN